MSFKVFKINRCQKISRRAGCYSAWLIVGVNSFLLSACVQDSNTSLEQVEYPATDESDSESEEALSAVQGFLSISEISQGLKTGTPLQEGDAPPQVRSWKILAGDPLPRIEDDKRYVICFLGQFGAFTETKLILNCLNVIASEFDEYDVEVIAVLWNKSEDKIYAEKYLKNYNEYLMAIKNDSGELGIRMVEDSSGEINRAWNRGVTMANTFVVNAGRITWTGMLQNVEEDKLRSALKGEDS